MNNINFTIISFYQFRKLLNLNRYKIFLKEFCFFHKMRGTILLAEEGINGTIAGFSSSSALFEKKLKSLGFDNLELKYTYNKFMPFNRLKIKIKKSIITFSRSTLDVENNTAHHVNPKDWNKLIENKNTLILDIRNEFEYELGTFKKSISSKIKRFSDFKKYVDHKLYPNKFENIAMFCTGGIRCEKASSYMLSKGFNNLFQLKGGILRYLKEVPKEKTKWKGECFVFDNRVAVKNDLAIGTYELCHGCRMPLSRKNRLSTKYEKGVTCPKCFDKLSKDKLQRLRERNKQIEIAKQKGLYNPYIKFTPTDFS